MQPDGTHLVKPRLHDAWAEITVLGCAIFDPYGSDLAHNRLNADDFGDDACARLFLTTPHLPTAPPCYASAAAGPLLWEARAAEASRRTGIRLEEVRQVVNRRLVLHDLTGHYAERVVAAAEARRQLQTLTAQARRLGYILVPLELQ